MTEDKKRAEPDENQKVRFHFLKSNLFRTIHADGVFGGVTPTLGISMAFYSQRQPLPDQTVHLISSDGTLGAEIEEDRISSKGIVRELETNVMIDVVFAKVLINWLEDKVKQVEQAVSESTSEEVLTDGSGHSSDNVS